MEGDYKKSKLRGREEKEKERVERGRKRVEREGEEGKRGGEEERKEDERGRRGGEEREERRGGKCHCITLCALVIGTWSHRKVIYTQG